MAMVYWTRPPSVNGRVSPIPVPAFAGMTGQLRRRQPQASAHRFHHLVEPRAPFRTGFASTRRTVGMTSTHDLQPPYSGMNDAVV
jgi:hypothetical protein